jgi:hypothetical protein
MLVSYRGVRGSETPTCLSAVVVLVVATALLVLGLAAFLDRLALFARAQPGLAGVMIRIAGVLRLLSHFDLRW